MRVRIIEVDSDGSWFSGDGATNITRDRTAPLGEVIPADGSGFSRSGGPDAEVEEQADQPIAIGTSTGPVVTGEVKQAPAEGRGPRLLRAPRALSDSERDRRAYGHASSASALVRSAHEGMREGLPAQEAELAQEEKSNPEIEYGTGGREAEEERPAGR